MCGSNEIKVNNKGNRNENVSQTSVLREMEGPALGGWGVPPHLRVVDNGCDNELCVRVDELPHPGFQVLLAQGRTCGLKRERKLDSVSVPDGELLTAWTDKMLSEAIYNVPALTLTTLTGSLL